MSADATADGDTLPAGLSRTQVWAWQQGQVRSRPDELAVETPVALVFNGISHAVMLATPADLEDFALGFGLSEGLLAHPGELYGCEVVAAEQGIELQLEVASACAHRLKDRRRTLAGKTGCGLCGTDSLAQVCRSLPRTAPVSVQPQALARAQDGLRQGQVLQQRCGATHAAAWCDLQGQVQVVREDVGRHNALDKLIGAVVKQGFKPDQGWVCVTSRASFEMVQKTAMLGAGMLAAVSAPTALACETALSSGVALAGFVRGPDFVAYTFPERFGLGPTGPASTPTESDHGHR